MTAGAFVPAFTLLAIVTFASSPMAYPTFSQGKVVNPDGVEESFGNCKTCHGNFPAGTYVSLKDREVWKEVYTPVSGGEPEEFSGLHDIHRFIIVDKVGGSRCSVCHTRPPFYPVLLRSSTGSTPLAPLGCAGCHGRAEDETSISGPGAGLRQHHTNAGVNECKTCHADADPARYTPVGEHVPPPYYFQPDAVFPNKPTNACNQAGEEDYAGSWKGLDNDGDGAYDIFDSDCAPLLTTDLCHVRTRGSEPDESISVGASAVAGHLAHGDTLGACPQSMR